jgi:hypothetical protein
MDALLTEYARVFQSRLNFVEETRCKTLLEEVNALAAATASPASQKFTRRSALLTTALERAEKAQGCETFEGQALDQQGLVQSGKVAVFGPMAMFASASGKGAGLLQQELNKSDPLNAPDELKLRSAVRP